MIWIGTIALTACMFVSPARTREGLPSVDEHAFLNLTESCTCCHDTKSRDGEVAPHDFVVDINENCRRCHDHKKIGRSHPVGVPESEKLRDLEIPEDLPVDEDGAVTCGTCHNPHLPGYLPERFTVSQQPTGTLEEEGRQVAYYKSYRLRLHGADAGNDPTCAACHREYF